MSASETAINILVESRTSYSSVLSLFQQNHDLILRSGLFAISGDFITSLDQSALSFQSLGRQTVSIASKVSDEWIGEVLAFYNDLENNSHSDNVSKLDLLGNQAKKLGQLFSVIAEWSRDLAGRVHSTNEQYKRENFTVLSYAVFETAGMPSSVDVSIVVLTAAATGALAATKATYSEEQARQQIEDDYQKLKNSFDGQTVVGKRQLIGQLVANLDLTFEGMSTIAESLATFWTDQSNTFTAEGGRMIANQARLPRPVLNNVMKTISIDKWTSIKEVFESYSSVLSKIIGLYETSTAAQPLETATYVVSALGMGITVPTSVDAAKILVD